MNNKEILAERRKYKLNLIKNGISEEEAFYLSKKRYELKIKEEIPQRKVITGCIYVRVSMEELKGQLNIRCHKCNETKHRIIDPILTRADVKEGSYRFYLSGDCFDCQRRLHGAIKTNIIPEEKIKELLG